MNWNLDPFYTNEDDWNKDLEALKSLIPVLEAFEGKLNNFDNFKVLYCDFISMV